MGRQVVASLLREAVGRTQDFLLEPARVAPGHRSSAHLPMEVVVLGLSAGCGATTLARALTLSLQPAVVVRDAGSTDAGLAHRADAVVLVAGRNCEPALAELASCMLHDQFGRVVLVANRVTDASRWSDRPAVCVPDSWLGAALLGRGWRPAGAFGAALAQLANRVAEEL